MKNETSRGKRFFKVASCARKISVLLIAAPLLLFPAAAFSNNGTIAFRGHVTNPGCAVQFSPDSTDTQNVRYLKVSERYTLKVDKLRNVCDGEVMPFVISYQARPAIYIPPVSSETAVLELNVGIITLTYQ